MLFHKINFTLIIQDFYEFHLTIHRMMLTKLVQKRLIGADWHICHLPM